MHGRWTGLGAAAALMFQTTSAQALQPARDVEIESVAFNFAGSGGVPLWDNRAGHVVPTPQSARTANALVNPNADADLDGWTSWGAPVVAQEDANAIFVLPQEGSHVHQDIDLSDHAELIDAGLASVTLSGRVRAAHGDVREGFPYLYGYLMGTADHPNRINTYMTTGAVRETEWTDVRVGYPVPPHTRTLRLFLMRSSVRDVDDANTAYFDDLSVTLLLPVEPAAVAAHEPRIVRARFRAPASLARLEVWATGDAGGLASALQPVEVDLAPVVGGAYRTGQAIFSVNSPPVSVGRKDLRWQWHYRSAGEPGWVDHPLGWSGHRVYVLLAQPMAPMAMPWVEVVDYAAAWAAGESTPAGTATQLRAGLNGIGDLDGDVDYDPSSFYLGEIVQDGGENKWVLLLSSFLEDLRSVNDIELNCYDSAYLLKTFAAAIGVSLEPVLIMYDRTTQDGCYMFRTNHIDPIGNGSGDPAQPPENCGPTVWVAHVVTSLDDGVEPVFDATLDLDGDGSPGSPPCSRLAPANMSWGAYEPLLVDPQPAEGLVYPYCTGVYARPYMDCVAQ